MNFKNYYLFNNTGVINRKNLKLRFQYCVILDSNETQGMIIYEGRQFQYCVILDSNETMQQQEKEHSQFQYCVILDSNETHNQNS